MIMIPASSSPTAAIFASRSSRSTEPSAAVATTTTFRSASTADAALVPWAEDGMRMVVRRSSPRERW
ncbi:hypothetical protein BJF77_06025 [Kocuria sp. CNJ-770]|nr:hypothetical protein BJF77_06025 [Kocuria sp. CNJ-770]